MIEGLIEGFKRFFGKFTVLRVIDMVYSQTLCCFALHEARTR